MISFPGFLIDTLSYLEILAYLALTYFCNHNSETSVTLHIPAKDSLSSNSLSIKSVLNKDFCGYLSEFLY